MHSFIRAESINLAAVLFLTGIVTFQQLDELPVLYWGLSLAIIIPLAWFYPNFRSITIFIGGFLWAMLQAQIILFHSLDTELEGQDITVYGSIASLPEVKDRRVRFEFEITQLLHNGQAHKHPQRIRLSWYDQAPELKVGQSWQLVVRLKRPHGLMNPGGFDYEGWLYQNRIRATGYVRDSDDNKLLGAPTGRYVIAVFRERLAAAIRQQLPDSAFAGVITALAIGDVREISARQWEVFRRTGTTHLIAISGMHITLIASLLFYLIKAGWSRSVFLVTRIPAPTAAGMGALIAALAYALLAGFSIPTQRAWLMITVAMIALMFKRQRAISHVLAIALIAVLLLDPFAVMDVGFWLSFGAVAIIFFGTAGRLRPSGWWWKWGKIHVLITIGLTPLLLLFFQQLSWVSPLANFIAVPWVTFLVIPPALIGTVLVLPFPLLAQPLFEAGNFSMATLWRLLELLAQPAWVTGNQAVPSLAAFIAAAIGVALLLAPRGIPIRWLGVFWFLPLLMMRPSAPAAGAYQFTLLDVGQGLAAVLRTQEHVLIFDTGPRFSADFDTGQAVIVPYLIAQGIKKIDVLIVSHGDNDHKGGVESLLELYPVEKILSSVPEQINHATATSCVAGQRWRWNEVDFEILHPPVAAAATENNLSCVLRVSNGAGSVLLTGDIEKQAEAELLASSAAKLKTDILVVPHHGSKTSSSDDFVVAAAPSYALFPVGYRNRFNFPRSEIVEKYRMAGSQLFDSARHGAITFSIDQEGVGEPRLYRHEARRYWHIESSITK